MINEITNRNNKLRVVGVVTGACLVHLSLGGVYSYTDFNEVVMNITHINCTPKLKCLENQIQHTMTIFAFAMFGLGSSMSFGGYIMTKLSPGKTIFLGSIIMNLGIVFTYFTAKGPLPWLVFTYGFIVGVGAGLGFSVSLSVSTQYFTRFKGLILGVTFSPFGCGSFISYYIRSSKTVETHEKYYFLICSGTFFIITLIGSLMIEYCWTRTEEHTPEEIFDILSSSNCSISDQNFGPHELIFEFDFWILWLCFCLNIFATILMFHLHEVIELLGNIKQIKHPYLVAIPNAIGVIFWGLLIDVMSIRNAIAIMGLVSSSIHSISILFCQYLLTDNVLHGNSSYIILLVFLNFWFAGNYSLYSGIILKRFGQEYFAQNFGLLWTAYSFAGIILSFAITLMVQDYLKLEVTFIAFCVMSFISFLLALFYIGRSRRLRF